MVAICDQCVEQAASAVADADPAGDRELFLPPRVFGEGSSPEAASEIASAFRVVFST
jgi:hypothetical protein